MFYPYTLQQILLCSIPMPFSRIFSVLSLCPSADSSMFYPYTLQQILLCSIPMPFSRIFSVLSLCPSEESSLFYPYTLQQIFSVHLFIPAISIAPLQVLYYSEALPTTARILYRSFTPKRTGNCRYRTCPRSLGGG